MQQFLTIYAEYINFLLLIIMFWGFIEYLVLNQENKQLKKELNGAKK